MIRIENLSFGYRNGKTVIRDMTAGLHRGRIYGLFGVNGAGKTTLMKLLAGMLFPKRGSITMDGHDVSARGIETLRETFFMQSEFQFGRIGIRKFVWLYSGFYPAFSIETFEDCLMETGVDPETGNLAELSLGEKHKVLAAMAIASGTGLLLMDEPTGGMDIPSRETFRRLLLKHTGEEQTVVISTHHATDLKDILSDVIILDGNGSTAFTGSVDEISDRYSFGTAASDEGALYSVPCAGGYRVMTERVTGEPTEIDLEMLFNAAIKGRLE